MRHNHIGCICLTFPQCAFLNVSSNRLPGRMHNHIGCIFRTFLHCVFSNVSSKRLPEKQQLTIREEAQSHWLHLFVFSPLCVFKCVLKTLAEEDAKSHWLHLFDFSPVCIFKCVLKMSALGDAKSHWFESIFVTPNKDLVLSPCLFKPYFQDF